MPAPVINSSATAAATRFGAFTYTITATGTPFLFGANNLPAGFTLNTGTGVITSDPVTVVARDYVIQVNATNGSGASANFDVTITVSATGVGLFKGLFKDWQENNYLRAIVCLLQTISGTGSGSGSGLPSIPGGAAGVTTTPVVIPAGMYAISVNVTAGTVTPGGAGTEFDGSAWPVGSYTITSAGPGFVLPEITLIGNGSAAYTVIWTHN